MRSLKLLSIFKVLEKSWRPFTSLKLYKRFQNPHPVPRAASDPNKTQPHHLLNHLQEKQQKEKFYFSYLVFSKQNIKEILRLHSESCATLRYKATTFCGRNRPNIISNAMYSITIGCQQSVIITKTKSAHPEVFWKALIKNILKFTGKHPLEKVFSSKFAVLQSTTLLKRNSRSSFHL